jgi:hypothetical protein
MLIRYIIYILFLLLTCNAFSQNEIIVSGQVFSVNTTEPLSYSQVVLNHKNGVITNVSGQFKIPVNIGDTLTATYIGYKSVEYIIPDTLPKNEYVIGFFLNINPYQLGEVVIYPRYTVEELKRQMVTAIPLSVDEQNARQNLDIAKGTAFRENHLYDNPQQYQDISIGKQQVKTEYKGMLSPDQIAGVNFVTVIGLAYGLIKKNLVSQKDEELYVNERDTRKLWEFFNEGFSAPR